RSHCVDGLVDPLAGAILRLADDSRFFDCTIGSLLLLCSGDHRELIDGLVFAVGLIGSRVEVAHKRSFDNGAHSFGGATSFRDLRAMRSLVSLTAPILRRDEVEAAHPFRFYKTNSSASHFAQLVRRKVLRL